MYLRTCGTGVLYKLTLMVAFLAASSEVAAIALNVREMTQARRAMMRCVFMSLVVLLSWVAAGSAGGRGYMREAPNK